MLIQSIFKDIKSYSKENSISTKEATKELIQFSKDLTLFKARIPLIESIEIDIKENIKDSENSSYLKLTKGEDILAYIMNLKVKSNSFKVLFTNGAYYTWYENGKTQYRDDHNRHVINFLLNYI